MLIKKRTIQIINDILDKKSFKLVIKDKISDEYFITSFHKIKWNGIDSRLLIDWRHSKGKNKEKIVKYGSIYIKDIIKNVVIPC